ncbi:hypothetical protein QAD02_015800 [Eretmocerus hayati]|uniref:Uncharacterized protein n=1 Tax=Eretmocerus hayati TaxID=131215 RepID=A0ACC2PA86_9HYME|nr:hypothetical protein QAD02_015800 [Eretmocerus hayati]
MEILFLIPAMVCSILPDNVGKCQDGTCHNNPLNDLRDVPTTDDVVVQYGNLLQFLKDAVLDSNIIKNSKIDRKKLTVILRDVIAPAQEKRLASILKDTDFVICIDGSTDITEISSICVVVQYFDKEKKKTLATLWDLLSAYKRGNVDSTANAETIFQRPIIPEKGYIMAELYREFLLMYMKREHVLKTDLNEIDPEDTKNFKQISRMNIGKKTETYLEEWESIIEKNLSDNLFSQLPREFEECPEEF